MLTLGAATAAATLLLGLYLARRASTGVPAPLPLGLAHAALGIATVALLAVLAFDIGAAKLVNAALLLFAFALVGGLFVLIFRLQGDPPPLFMVYLHAASAVLAAILLGTALVSGG